MAYEGSIDDMGSVNECAWRLGKTGSTVALLATLLPLAGTGCSLDNGTGPNTTADPGESSSSSPATSTSAGDTGSASDSSGAVDSARLHGVFHPEKLTDELKWEKPSPEDDGIEHLIWWENVSIEPDRSMTVEYYACGGLDEVHSFTWEPDGEGIRVVPPSGEGAAFKWGASDVVGVSIAPGTLCGELLVSVHIVGADKPLQPWRYVPGRLCTINVSDDACEFEFKWCEGPPTPPVCE